MSLHVQVGSEKSRKIDEGAKETADNRQWRSSELNCRRLVRCFSGTFLGAKLEKLAVRALHLLSGAEYNLSEYSKAIDDNQRSLLLAEQMGDAIGTFNTLSILIEQYRYIGNYEQSLACIHRSLSLLDSCTLNEVQIAQHYGIIASALSSSGFYHAAAEYQKEALRRASTTGQIQTISRAHADLGSIYAKMGNYGEALKHAKFAYETARSHSDQSIKLRMMAYAALEIGDLYKEAGDTTKAIESSPGLARLMGLTSKTTPILVLACPISCSITGYSPIRHPAKGNTILRLRSLLHIIHSTRFPVITTEPVAVWCALQFCWARGQNP